MTTRNGMGLGVGTSTHARRALRSGLTAVTLIASIALLLASGEAAAQTGRTTSGFFLRNGTALRYNPLGLFNETRVGYRRRLFASDESFFQNTFVAIGAQVSLSPAFGRAGVALEFQPLSILSLYAVYEVGGYFGSFGLAQSFVSANSRVSDQVIENRRDLQPSDPLYNQLHNYSTPLHQLQLGAVFQIRLGGLIVRSNNRFVYEAIGIRSGDRVFYDQYWEILFPNQGWIYVNDVDVLLEPFPSLRIGFRYNVTHAFYTASDFPSGVVEPTQNSTTHRIGPLVAYTFFERRHGAFNAPTLALVVNWWLQHPSRTGGNAPDAITQALPYIALAFSFRYDP